MKKDKKHNSSITSFYFVIFIISLLLFLGCFIKFEYFPGGDFLAYSGAIIGGGMTLIGVNMTIVRQNKIHDEQLMVQYRPIVLLNDSNFDWDDDFDITFFDFKLVNAGRGEATNIEIDIKIDSANEINDYLLSYNDEFPILVSNAEINYKIYFEVDYEKYYSRIDEEAANYTEIEDSEQTSDFTTTFPPFPHSKVNLEVSINYSDFKGKHYETRLLIILNRHHSLLRQRREKDYKSHWTNKIEFLEYKEISK